MKYKFSVLYPVHDDVDINKITKSIKSIVDNSFKPNEVLILVDGYISDDKRLFFKKINKKFRYIKIVNNKKIGLSKILNKGLTLAKNEIIFRADSDDFNYKDRFKKQMNYFTKKKLDIMGCFLVEHYGSKKLIRKTPKYPRILLSMIINPINHMTVVYRKKSIINLNGYPNIEYKEDMALWIKSLINGLKIENMQTAQVRTDVDTTRYKKRKNFLSIISELKLFIFILKLKPFFFIFALLSMIIRIFYLLLPNRIFKFLQIIFFRR